MAKAIEVQKPGQGAQLNRSKSHTFSKNGDERKALVNPKYGMLLPSRTMRKAYPNGYFDTGAINQEEKQRNLAFET
jgi:hypothetical protein